MIEGFARCCMDWGVFKYRTLIDASKYLRKKENTSKKPPSCLPEGVYFYKQDIRCIALKGSISYCFAESPIQISFLNLKYV